MPKFWCQMKRDFVEMAPIRRNILTAEDRLHVMVLSLLLNVKPGGTSYAGIVPNAFWHG